MKEQSAVPESRRGFLRWVAAIAGATSGLIATVPFLGAVLFPLRARTVREGEGFIVVAHADELHPGVPVKATVRASRYDAWNQVQGVELASVWLEKTEQGSVIALSSICPHLGCSVDFLSEGGTFNCPCHGSVFAKGGRVVSGPSPRPLDALETRVEGGRVLVKFERFACGIAAQRKA
jgi:Rieske Fe-S protein